ncbi:MAG TPA: SURF1 family protein [Lapillicoccus sp.]|nr:SURF1 family protein [Lapillicoccus sp.]
MVTALASRRMLGGLALAVAFALACVLLGRWQWGRYEDRLIQATAVTTHYAANPVPLAEVTSRIPLSEPDQWLRVTTTGRYASGQQLLVRNRALDGQPGLEVLVPLDLSGSLAGTRVFVDRGWVANADSAADLPPVPAAPTGDVTVEGWLRSGEPDLGKNLPAGQLASIDLAEAGRQTGGGTALDAYLVLGSEQPAAPRPEPLAAPDTDLGPHQAYAIQWWLTALFGFVLLGYRVRVAAAENAEATAPRPKKVRIWDEEDS